MHTLYYKSTNLAGEKHVSHRMEDEIVFLPNIPVVNTSFPLGAREVPVVSLGGTRASTGT
jgi:hypothetical protein